jgi:SAM-dependent methyltransferase
LRQCNRNRARVRGPRWPPARNCGIQAGVIEDRARWNEKYRDGSYPAEPSALVRDYHRLAPGPVALDIAAGNGRNAVFLARQGFRVDAVDISDAGLALFPRGVSGIRPICADLDVFEIPARRYDLIVNILYLNRRLFPQIRCGLKPGGLLIFESLLRAEAGEPDGGGHRREYYLEENELLHGFLDLRILHYHETREADRRGPKAVASLVGLRKADGRESA